MLVPLFSAIAFSAQLVHIDFFYNYPVFDMYSNCNNFTAPIVGSIRDVAYANGVGVILRSNELTAYLIKGPDEDEWQILFQVPVEGYQRVITDGRKVYICGEACEALDLRGNVLWVAHVKFDGSKAKIGLASDTLIVPNAKEKTIYFVKEGDVIKKIKKEFESIDFCGGYYALIYGRTLEVGKIKDMKPLWKKEGAWDPYRVKFSTDCNLVGVNTLSTIYIYETKTGRKVDKVSSIM